MGPRLLKGLILAGSLVLSYAQFLPPLPTPVTSGYTQQDLDQCEPFFLMSQKLLLSLTFTQLSVWQSVEQIGVPVVKANITQVLEPTADFSVGPEPPRFRPAYLQATTKILKLPKGFLYGVSTSATQTEGAVKEGGRGPR